MSLSTTAVQERGNIGGGGGWVGDAVTGGDVGGCLQNVRTWCIDCLWHCYSGGEGLCHSAGGVVGLGDRGGEGRRGERGGRNDEYISHTITGYCSCN